MGKRLEIKIGEKFNRLTIIKEVEPFMNKKGYNVRNVSVKCDCGVIKVVKLSSLRSGNTKSCGCLAREASLRNIANQRNGNKKHGLRYHHLYNTWLNMKNRCLNPKCTGYMNYGGRGITICQDWKESFVNFLNDVSVLANYSKKGYSLDRIDNNGNYESLNVRWANRETQANNRRVYKNACIVEINNKEYTLKQLSIDFNLPLTTVDKRYHKGLRGKELTKPIKSLKNEMVTIDKIQYKLIELAKLYNIDYRTIRSRFNNGKKGKELIKPKKKKVLEKVNGIYMTIQEISDTYSLPKKTIAMRYTRGVRGNNLVKPLRNKS